MRYLIYICSLLFLTSCSTNTNFKKPAWLVGKWIRVNEEENNKTYEFWNEDFTGLGFTLQESDTTFVEKMSFIANNNNLYLKVTGLGEDTTLFAFTKQSDDSFIVENNRNQFPKKIEYRFNGNTLKTIISNEEFSIDFTFNKLK